VSRINNSDKEETRKEESYGPCGLYPMGNISGVSPDGSLMFE
jgi:hypothetical protein